MSAKTGSNKYEHLWRRSPSPQEDFGGAEGEEDDGTWAYEIIGEEMDLNGSLKYEVRWETWSRPDGTKTTWHSKDDPTINSSSWDKARKERLRQIASAGLDMTVQTTTDFHNSATYEHHQAFSEKLALARKLGTPNLVEQMRRLMAYHEHLDGHEDGGPDNLAPGTTSTPVRSSKRLSSRNPSATPSSLAGSSRSPSTSTSSTRRERQMIVEIRSQGKGKGKARYDSNIDSSSEEEEQQEVTPKRRRIVRSESQSDVDMDNPSSSGSMEANWCQLSCSRKDLQRKWNRAAKKAGAAPITIVNLVDNEEIPKLRKSFKYLESSYKFAEDVEEPPDAGFLMTCDCDGPEGCTDADICGCQGESMVVDIRTKSKVYAYNEQGGFQFNVARGVEVIECNQSCACGPSTCPNRVSQKPRDVPIEIFKTDERGWGARSSVRIRKGKVLGIYTGTVIHREAYMGLSDEDTMYIFDLDGDERADNKDHVPHKLYSVDAMLQGNWTRFINHSCSPNLQVYLVVHNVPSGIGMPFIAFVASQDIPAMTEFTLDYDPKAGEMAKEKGKKKAKYVPKPGENRCSCGSQDCRGYMP